MDRRQFLHRTLAIACATTAGACGSPSSAGNGHAPSPAAESLRALRGTPDWETVRAQFDLDHDVVQLGALYIASHPAPVREAIGRYRRELDRNPVTYLDAENRRRRAATLAAAARYLDADAGDIALTDSTTMGLGLVYNGLRLRRGQEILTTEHDYFATHEAVRVAAARTGAARRRVRLFPDAATVSADAVVDAARRALAPRTRVLGITWVHSSTGVKLPVARIAAAVADANRGRDDDDRVLLVVDGVHGFGVEDVTADGLGADFLVAGCHKWLFGPRGTGLVWGRPGAWSATRPTIPSFIDDATWLAWLHDREPRSPATAARMTPGGFQPFEHQWAMREAFELHLAIGKARVAERTHALARQLKEGLAGMAHVTLRTPMADDLSAGIVCFDVDGRSAHAAVQALRDRGIVATVTPYAELHVRMAPSIYNTPDDVDRALRAVRALR
ncbi:MAG: aminotransferase class V-fold PLP-dependent enzyme [Candidatus Rokubacteria bacterium]|nr:aminotransferase class V-fold PLP-dependent enzyme [Candidatus Rokubacteria bacterium]